MPSITGYKNRILAAAPGISDGRAERMAKKLAYWAANMQEELDFYAALRVLGIHADDTAREAIESTEVAA